MSRLHICNTFFERELETSSLKTLEQWMQSHPIVKQLQFLPLLYADSTDRILVSELPPNPDPRLCLMNAPPKGYEIEHWGPSQAIALWAQKHQIPYSIPDWESVRHMNSKIFSFLHTPRLPGAALLENEQEIASWLASTPRPHVFKRPFGTAGNGHIINPDVKQLYKTPLLAEPWVERVVDFSSQWNQGKFLGATLFENDAHGSYQGTRIGYIPDWALEEHLKVARPLIEKIGQMGYWGNIGIDAFIYFWEGQQCLHPVVEINARKTMSWVALQIPAKQLNYTLSESGLLPNRLGNTSFSRNITGNVQKI
jgi:hypothetical protein